MEPEANVARAYQIRADPLVPVADGVERWALAYSGIGNELSYLNLFGWLLDWIDGAWLIWCIGTMVSILNR